MEQQTVVATVEIGWLIKGILPALILAAISGAISVLVTLKGIKHSVTDVKTDIQKGLQRVNTALESSNTFMAAVDQRLKDVEIEQAYRLGKEEGREATPPRSN